MNAHPASGERWLADERASADLAARLAARQPFGAVVHLRGDLGAGKSTLARAWLRHLGVTGTVRSPTYTLVERYPLATGGEALHLDLYRIGDPGELEFLGLDDADAALWLVEWPQRGQGALPAADLGIALRMADHLSAEREADGASDAAAHGPMPGRIVGLEAHSARGQRWLAEAGFG